jgi:nucleolar protein 12
MKPIISGSSRTARVPKPSAEVQFPDYSDEADSIRTESGFRIATEKHDFAPEPDQRQVLISSSAKSPRKRKRTEVEDDVEGRYISRLAREAAEEAQRRKEKDYDKRRKIEALDTERDENSSEQGSNAVSIDGIARSEDKGAQHDVPLHESVATSSHDTNDLEKSSRTVFLANVSTLAIKSKTAKRTLLEHLASVTSLLPKQDVKHGLESLRFRSTAFASSRVPKKAAFAKKELMDNTTQSTNAYAVYTTHLAAREATKKLNGSMILDRHLRVDSVAHPAKIDHRRCVFVGNLGFVDDETNINAAEDDENGKSRRKAKEPADVEEGLWRQFAKAGAVESVRVVRDKSTRVGKGFAYVQFEDANAVEGALLFNEKKYPPRLPRNLRVTRAKNMKRTGGQIDRKKPSERRGNSKSSYDPKVSPQVQSLGGRVGKLLGHAGAARVRAATARSAPSSEVAGVTKVPQSLVFEGYRASRLQGKGVLKIGGSRKSQGKPRTRSSRRGAEFKATGGKKARS